MEDALVPINISGKTLYRIGLNPCCNGRCTRTMQGGGLSFIPLVLILVVMEDALVQEKRWFYKRSYWSLNPCCNGRCTRTVIANAFSLQMLDTS